MMMTVLGIGAVALSVLVFVVIYLLLIASSRAEETEARVQARLLEARAGRPGAWLRVSEGEKSPVSEVTKPQ